MEERKGALNREEAAQARVIVVGGGVSGCACASRLAVGGVYVTVISSALDVVGLPGYGPEMSAGPGGWTEIGETLGLLPEGLRWAWLNSGAVPESGEPVLVVDRRAVSIESKRALETIPGLTFRQGLITDVRIGTSDCDSAGAESQSGGGARTAVEVETAFGEVFQADAVVLAPGLAFRGRIEVGDEVIRGGRYGEVPADELCEALEALGVTFEETTVEVGPRYSRDSFLVRTAFVGASVDGGNETTLTTSRLVPARAVVLGTSVDGSWDQANLGEAVRTLRAPVIGAEGYAARQAGAVACGPDGNHAWPDEFPPAPHWTEALRSQAAVVLAGSRRTLFVADLDRSGPACLAVAPDGAATAEYYVESGEVASVPDGLTSGPSEEGSEPGEGITRLGHCVRALIPVGSDAEGRLPAGPDRIRVAGRSAGAGSYLESLRSGVRVADSLLRVLRGEGDPE
jgi:hypothetical protein